MIKYYKDKEGNVYKKEPDMDYLIYYTVDACRGYTVREYISGVLTDEILEGLIEIGKDEFNRLAYANIDNQYEEIVEYKKKMFWEELNGEGK